MRKVIIAAVAENKVIGRSTGEMPWHIKEEYQHFKNTTLGFPIIMGRKTFESLEKPLKGRLDIILSKNKSLSIEGTITFNSLEEAYNYCSKNNYEKIFVIGGGHIFRDAIEDADEMIISRMKFKAEGDVYFPDIDNDIWRAEREDDRSQFTIYYYVRAVDKNDKD